MFRTTNRHALLAALAVLGASSPMLGDEPWFKRGDWRGDRRDKGVHRVEPRRVPRTPVVVIGRTPVVHEVRRDEAPCSVSFTAYQAGETVILIARGSNPHAGYATSLSACTFHGGGAHVTLCNVAPAHCGAAVVTPFEVSGSFRSRECLRTIEVQVAGMCHHVSVIQVGAIG